MGEPGFPFGQGSKVSHRNPVGRLLLPLRLQKHCRRAAQKGGETTGHSAVGEKKLSHKEFISKIRKELPHFGKRCSCDRPTTIAAT